MFDWCESHDRLGEVLEVALDFAQGAQREHSKEGSPSAAEKLRVLDVGCGTSTLALALWGEGRRRVHAVDIDPAVIEAMAAAHTSCRGLTWEVVDVTAAGEKLGSACFDLVVDKGTMDYLLCSELRPALAALHSMHNTLVQGGVLLVVSIHPLSLWQTLFAALLEVAPDALGFEELKAWSLEAGVSGGSARPTAALVMRRHQQQVAPEPLVWDPDLRAAAEDAAAAVMDQHFLHEAPLLTAEREAALRADFEAALKGEAASRLSAAEAHAVMFPSATEKAEYPLELFLEDLKEGGDDSTTRPSLSLDEAIDFLRRNQ